MIEEIEEAIIIDGGARKSYYENNGWREREQAIIYKEWKERTSYYNGWVERTSYIIMDEEREHAIIYNGGEERRSYIIVN